MSSENRRHDESLRGEYTLADASRVRIRPIEPRDARTLQAGFRELSPESRRRRFRGPKPRLTAAELRFLTECDGQRQLALGAVRLDRDGWECEGLGVARFVCLPESTEVAEPAVTVIDAVQGQGLGRLLSEHLIRAASARGVKTFRCFLMDERGQLRDRIARGYPDAQLTRCGPMLTVDIPLPALASRLGEDLRLSDARVHGSERFWSLLRWVAEGTVQPGRPGALRSWLERAFLRPIRQRRQPQ